MNTCAKFRNECFVSLLHNSPWRDNVIIGFGVQKKKSKVEVIMNRTRLELARLYVNRT